MLPTKGVLRKKNKPIDLLETPGACPASCIYHPINQYDRGFVGPALPGAKHNYKKI